ncbi:SagB/ThcOx family dehydrogenase [Colwellia sp. Bg11-28]|uniref:SagB/ThcOx family dehydrogenase n=1 Tax=Colwellia sp. Bg11-28 TaxID=2058305 RepID=UPI000C31FD32|nr:SagB/ThcOx family dehydrogenase [Colwellia sp. Bg11-28]PKH85431.1 hypothetical protein CXF79_19400 [Colwellia sp. Bg11-28]
MSVLKRKAKIASSEKHWVESQAAIVHEYTKYSEMELLKRSPRIVEYLVSPRTLLESTRNFKEYLHENSISLPIAESTKHDYVNLLKTRRSSRGFSGKSLPFQELSNLLGWSVGTTKKVDMTNPELKNENVHFRSYPSGGGLYPCEFYVIALNIDELDAGVYHYDNINHALDPINKVIDLKEIECCFLAEKFINDIACIVVVTSVFERTVTKYGDRGYRLALLEAGHLMQNILLSATAQNLASITWGGFHDNSVATMLNTDVISEPPVHAAFIGKAKVT